MADTIFAFATGEMRSAIAVMRVCGPDAQKAGVMIAGGVLPPRKAVVRTLRCPSSGEVLDQAVVLWFPGPASFSGDDSLEFHIHGGGAVRRALVDALAGIEGCRAARPGEFTRRAFLNGKLDLAQIEGLGDLLSAETELQRRQAILNLDGGLSKEADQWRSMLLDAAGLIEALLDFADEGDAPRDVEVEVRGILTGVIASMERQLAGSHFSELIQRGARVVITGPPNAGKSSLLNALAKRDVAIVTDIAGTTRDLVEVRLDLEGVEVVLVDTAGVRATSDPVEQLGVEKALKAVSEADLVLRLFPADEDIGLVPAGDRPARSLNVISKFDLLNGKIDIVDEVICVSVRDSASIQGLLGKLRQNLLQSGGADHGSLLTNRRQIECVSLAVTQLRRALSVDFRSRLEIAGFHVQGSLTALGELIGDAGPDKVLDVVFAKFCMGK